MTYDYLITGAGLVGLATAFQLSKQKPDASIMVIDKAKTVAAHQSGHNSGVIHSGVYYPPGKTRALHCRRGYQLLLDFCEEHHIAYELCGKIIVATNTAEKTRLSNILERGKANGLTGISMVTPEEYRDWEPHAGGIAAIHVPQSGIVDYPAMAQKMQSLLQQAGHEVKLQTKLLDIHQEDGQIIVNTNQGTLSTKQLINCAGLYSDKVADLTGNGNKEIRILPFRGEYYKLREDRTHLVRGLIYPVPNPAFPFLGVHFTKMVRGGVEAGPNAVLAFAREGYNNQTIHLRELMEILAFKGFRKLAWQHWQFGLNELRRSFSKKAFLRALQPLLPEIGMDDLVPGGAGVRAMACDQDGQMFDDFLFWQSPGILNVANAPSPAATACLAIGETIVKTVVNG